MFVCTKENFQGIELNINYLAKITLPKPGLSQGQTGVKERQKKVYVPFEISLPDIIEALTPLGGQILVEDLKKSPVL